MKELMALSHPRTDQGSVSRESHGPERLAYKMKELMALPHSLCDQGSVDFASSHEGTYEPFDGNTTTVGAKRLRLRGSIVLAKFHCSRMSYRTPRLFFPERHDAGVYTRKDLYCTPMPCSQVAPDSSGEGRRHTTVQYCQGHDHVPRERTVQLAALAPDQASALRPTHQADSAEFLSGRREV